MCQKKRINHHKILSTVLVNSRVSQRGFWDEITLEGEVSHSHEIYHLV